MNYYVFTINYGEYDSTPRMIKFFVPRGVTYEKLRRVFCRELSMAWRGMYRHKVELVKGVLDETARQCYGRYEIITPEEEFNLGGITVAY